MVSQLFITTQDPLSDIAGNMKITRILWLIYLLFGIINAIIFGVILAAAIDFSDHDTLLYCIDVVYLATAVYLMRAPYSRRNIDLPIHQFIKLVILLLQMTFIWACMKVSIEDADNLLIWFPVFGIQLATLILTLFMTPVRRKFFVPHLS